LKLRVTDRLDTVKANSRAVNDVQTPAYAARRRRNAGARKLFQLGLLARDSDSEDRRRDAFVDDFKFDSD
jgi:hypothetical protein